MAPKKLTEADKKSILELYREPEETTSTLADRYGVSNSTISRLLKASLPAKEYGRLIQQKRSTADKSAPVSKSKDSRPSAEAPPEEPASESDAVAAKADEEQELPASKPAPVLKKREPKEAPKAPAAEATPEPEDRADEREEPISTKRTRRRRGSSSPAQNDDQAVEAAAQLSIPEPEEAPETVEPPSKAPPKLKPKQAPAPVDEDDSDEDIAADWDEEDVSNLDDDYDEDDDDDDDDDFEDEGDTWEGDDESAAPHLEKLEIAPLTDASLPRLCYVVVERSSSELVALPLRTFAHLGEIPETEGESRTLPVFDNHRVARRFSRRNQRVVKLPDGGLLQTTSPYLMAKGITRLLIDGQVFALEDDDGGYDDDDGDFE